MLGVQSRARFEAQGAEVSSGEDVGLTVAGEVVMSTSVPPAGNGCGRRRDESVASVVDDLSRTKLALDGHPLGLLFTLIVDDRPGVVVDGATG